MSITEKRPSSFYPLDHSEIIKGFIFGMPVGFVLSKLDVIFNKYMPSFLIKNPQLEQGSVTFTKKISKVPLGKGIVTVLIVGAFPVAEEIVFRGILKNTPEVKKKEEPDSLSTVCQRALINSTLFALSHFEIKKGIHNVRWCGLSFISGIAFYALAENTGNLWAPTFAHSSTNAFVLKSIFKKI